MKGSELMEGLAQHPLTKFPDFRKLFLARLISAVGDKFFTIALAWWVISQDDATSKIHLGFLMAINILPVVILGPLLGPLVDRWDKKKCMLLADLFRGGIIASLAYFMLQDALTLPLVYILCFCLSSFIPLFEGAVDSSLIRLTDEESIGSAVAINASVVEMSNILGALLGSIFIAVVGIGGAFIGNSLSFLLSFIIILFIKTPLLSEASSEDYAGQIKEGFAYLASQRAILSLLVVFALFNFLVAPLILSIPLLVKYTLQEGVQWVAILEGCLAVGTVLGAVFLSFRNNSSNIYRTIFISLFAGGILITLIGLTTNKLIVSGLFFCGGVVAAYVNTLALSLFQNAVPYELKGRFFSLLATTSFAVLPLAYIISGFLAQAYSVSWILFASGLGSALLSFVILKIPRVSLPDNQDQETHPNVGGI